MEFNEEEWDIPLIRINFLRPLTVFIFSYGGPNDILLYSFDIVDLALKSAKVCGFFFFISGCTIGVNLFRVFLNRNETMIQWRDHWMSACWANPATYHNSDSRENIAWSQQNCTIHHCQTRVPWNELDQNIYLQASVSPVSTLLCCRC